MTGQIPDGTETPLEIPRLMITPSTPTDDPPVPQFDFGRGRRPSLFRSQSLLEQIDSQIPLNPAVPTRRSSPSKSRPEKEGMQGYHHHLTPFPFDSKSTSTVAATARQNRPGRGTAVSLLLVALAFLLVISSALFSSETITALLRSETEWMASDRVEMWIGAKTSESGSGSSPTDHDHDDDDQINTLYPSHYDEDELESSDTTSVMNWNNGPSRDPRTEQSTEIDTVDTGAEIEHHTTTTTTTTTGPVLTKDAWRSYLKRKELVTGQAGPTAHFEAWDFH